MCVDACALLFSAARSISIAFKAPPINQPSSFFSASLKSEMANKNTFRMIEFGSQVPYVVTLPDRMLTPDEYDSNAAFWEQWNKESDDGIYNTGCPACSTDVFISVKGDASIAICTCGWNSAYNTLPIHKTATPRRRIPPPGVSWCKSKWVISPGFTFY